MAAGRHASSVRILVIYFAIKQVFPVNRAYCDQLSNLKMLGSSCSVDEHTSTLDDEVYSHLSPWQFCGVTVGDDADGLAIYADVLVVNLLDIGCEGSQNGVVLQQVAGLLDSSGIVQCNDLQQ